MRTSMGTHVAAAIDKMKKNGYKHTKKREELLTFFARKNRYVSAKDAYDFMAKNYPGISFDTIYRNLHDFVALDILESTDLNGEKKFRFHCCHGEIGHHHHFICTVCGATREIHMCPMDFFEEQLADCEIEGHRFEIYGKCENCH